MGDLEGCQTAGNVELKPLIDGSDMPMVETMSRRRVKILD